MIRLARRRLDEARYLADDGAFGQSFDRLPDDAHRLAKFLDAYEVAVVGVARLADRHLEIHLVVRGVGLVLPDIVFHARSAKRRPRETDRDGVFSRDHADALGPLQPDAVIRQELLVVDELLRQDVAERQHLLVPAGRNVERQPTDAHRVVREPGAAELLEEVKDQFALAERVQEHGHRADIHRVRTKPEAVARDPLQLAHNRAQIPRPARHLERHQLLDRLTVADVVRRGGHVVHAIRDQNNLRPVAALTELLNPAMQISDHHIGAEDALAIQPQHHPQHAVRARMLRPHVEDELVGVEHGLRLGCWFHCASFTPRTGQRSKGKGQT